MLVSVASCAEEPAEFSLELRLPAHPDCGKIEVTAEDGKTAQLSIAVNRSVR